MTFEFDDMGLADGAANSLLYIWMKKFDKIKVTCIKYYFLKLTMDG